MEFSIAQIVAPCSTNLSFSGNPIESFTPIRNPTELLNRLLTDRINNLKFRIDIFDTNILIYLIIRWFLRNQQGNKLLVITPEPLSEEIYGPIQRLELYFQLDLRWDVRVEPTIRYHSRDFPRGGIEDPQFIEDLLRVMNDLLYSTAGQEGNILVIVAGDPEVSTLTQRWEAEPSLLDYQGYKKGKIEEKNEKGRIVIVPLSSLNNLDPREERFEAMIDTLQEIQMVITPAGAILPELGLTSQNRADLNSRYSPISYRMITHESYLQRPKYSCNDIRSNRKINERFLKYELILNRGIKLEDRKEIWVTRSPLSLRNGSILWDLLETEIPIFPAISAMALIDSFESNPPYYPFVYPLASSTTQSPSEYQQMISEHAEAYYGKYMGESDLETLLNIWMSYLNETGGFESTLTQTLRWSKKTRISISYLRRVKSLIKLTLKSLNNNIIIGPFTPRKTVEQLREYFRREYPSATHISDPMTESNPVYLSENRDLFHLTPYTNRSRLLANPPAEIIILSSTTIKDYNLNYINIGL